MTVTIGRDCRDGLHHRCSYGPCECPCHNSKRMQPTRPAAAPVRAATPPPSPPKERIVTDHIAEAARVLEERISAIDDELAEQNELRDERKKLEVALRKLRPTAPKPRAGRDTDTGPTLSTRILNVVKNGKEWPLTDLLGQLKLDGWTTTSTSPLQVIRPTCDKLVRTGELDRPSAGVYKAKA